MPIVIDDPDGGGDTRAIAVGVVGIFRNGAKHHVTVGQSRCVGESKGNAIDQTEVETDDSGRLDYARGHSLQTCENPRKRVADDRVVGVPLVAALKQAQLVFDNNRTFDVELGKYIVKRSENGRQVQFMRHSADRAMPVQAEQRAAAAIWS